MIPSIKGDINTSEIKTKHKDTETPSQRNAQKIQLFSSENGIVSIL
jgi:hypothetical protein